MKKVTFSIDKETKNFYKNKELSSKMKNFLNLLKNKKIKKIINKNEKIKLKMKLTEKGLKNLQLLEEKLRQEGLRVKRSALVKFINDYQKNKNNVFNISQKKDITMKEIKETQVAMDLGNLKDLNFAKVVYFLEEELNENNVDKFIEKLKENEEFRKYVTSITLDEGDFTYLKELARKTNRSLAMMVREIIMKMTDIEKSFIKKNWEEYVKIEKDNEILLIQKNFFNKDVEQNKFKTVYVKVGKIIDYEIEKVAYLMIKNDIDDEPKIVEAVQINGFTYKLEKGENNEN